MQRQRYCPECYFPLRDTALFCVSCGHIVYEKKDDNIKLYDMVIKKINPGNSPLFAYKAMQDYGVPKEDCPALLNTPDSVILKGVYKCYINYLYEKFQQWGYMMNFVPSSDDSVSPANSVIENEILEKSMAIQYRKANRQCPRCNSKNLHIDSISAFFNGGYKWKHRCKDCGYTWKVK